MIDNNKTTYDTDNVSDLSCGTDPKCKVKSNQVDENVGESRVKWSGVAQRQVK